jgi:LPXTG-motif cell wall-anchored protein
MIDKYKKYGKIVLCINIPTILYKECGIMKRSLTGILVAALLLSLALVSTAFAEEITATASTSSEPDWTPEYGIDGDPETFWCAMDGSFPQWYTVDLGAEYEISAVEATLYDVDTPWKYMIEGSTDNENWTLLADKTADGVETQYTKETVSGKYRYIKITVTYVDNGHWAAFTEVNVIKADGAAANPETGDNFNPLLMIGLIVVSGSVLLFTRKATRSTK